MISKEKPQDFKKKFDVVSCFIEHDSKILLLHRLDSKPQGNTWGVPAGKVDAGENLSAAIQREIREEIGLLVSASDLKFFDSFYVRYPDFDFTYHIFYLPLGAKPELLINPKEHKDYAWKTPFEALKLDLIPDEDACIKAFYKI